MCLTADRGNDLGSSLASFDPTKHGVLFERPTTIGYGGNERPFVFKRADANAK